MKKMQKRVFRKILAGILVVMGVFALAGEVNVLVGGEAWADGDCATILKFLCDGDKVADNAIPMLLLFIIDVLMGGVIVVGTIGIIIAGAQIMTARDNEEQLRQGKKRLLNIMIGIVLFIFLGVIMHAVLGESGKKAVEETGIGTVRVELGGQEAKC